jgi:hypothetical protein
MGKADAKPIRSLLFVPGTDEERLYRSVEHGADAVMIDLEEPRTPFPKRRGNGLGRECERS